MAESDDLDGGWEGDDAPSATPAQAPGGGAKTAPPHVPADRATLPPPMPEQEYIEQILKMEQAGPRPRQRLSTLIDHDPLQYDAPPTDENTRPTKPPASAVAGGESGGEDFLDLSLDLALDRSSAPEERTSDPGASALPPIPPPPPGPRGSLPSLDDLPIDDVLESLPPSSMAGRVLGSPSVPAPASVRPAPRAAPKPAASQKPPATPVPVQRPSALKAPPPRQSYDSTPTIEVVEVGSVPMGKTPPRGTAASPRGEAARALPVAAPERSAQAAPASSGVAAKAPPPARRPSGTKTPVAGTSRPPAGAVTPPGGTKGPHLGSGPQGARTTDRPTRALRTPLGDGKTEGLPDKGLDALGRVIEKFEAGDFGRALMLAEQAIESGETHDDLQHYAERCREKLRQTYVERIGSGRTILRVAVDAERMRERALDPRLAFLLSLLDGATTVDDVIDMASMPPLEAVRALHELLQEGIVEAVEPGQRVHAP